MSTNTLYEAIALIRAGKTEDARQIIFDIIRNDSQNEMAWMWLAETLTSEADRMKVLRSCLKINPDSKIAKMAVSKLQEKFNEHEANLPAETPFTEGATFDPSLPERTGHTGAIIGFDGSFILSEVPDFDDVIDLRTPSMATTKLPRKEDGQDFLTSSYNGDDLIANEESQQDAKNAASNIPTVPLGNKKETSPELEYEPDLSGLLDDEKTEFLPSPSKAPANRVPLYHESEEPFNFGQNEELSSDELGFNDDATQEVSPGRPLYADLMEDDLVEDNGEVNTEEGKKSRRKKKGGNPLLWLVAGLFLIIAVLCVVLVFLLKGNPLIQAPAVTVPTEVVAIVETVIPTATKTLYPTVTNTPAPTFTATLQPTSTPIVAISDNAITGLSASSLVLRLKETINTEFFTNLDGSQLALIDGRNIEVWDLASGELKTTLSAHKDVVTDAVFSADNKYLVSAARDFSVILWDLPKGEVIKVFGMDAGTINRIYGDRTHKYPHDVSVDYSPDGTTLAAGAFGFVNIFDIASGGVRGTYALTDENLALVAQDPNNLFGFIVKFNENGWVLGAAMSKNLIGLDSLDAAPLYQYELGSKAVVNFLPDRVQLVEADSGGVTIRDLVDGVVVTGYDGRKVKPNNTPPDYSISENDQLVGIEVDAQENQYGLEVWDVESDSSLMNFKGICLDNVCKMPTFSLFPESSRIAVTRQNNDQSVSIIIVNLFSNQIVYRFNLSDFVMRSIAVSPNEEVVAAIDGKGILHVWDLTSGEERGAIQTDNAAKVGFSRNGQILYAWSAKSIQAWGNP